MHVCVRVCVCACVASWGRLGGEAVCVRMGQDDTREKEFGHPVRGGSGARASSLNKLNPLETQTLNRTVCVVGLERGQNDLHAASLCICVCVYYSEYYARVRP